MSVERNANYHPDDESYRRPVGGFDQVRADVDFEKKQFIPYNTATPDTGVSSITTLARSCQDTPLAEVFADLPEGEEIPADTLLKKFSWQLQKGVDNIAIKGGQVYYRYVALNCLHRNHFARMYNLLKWDQFVEDEDDEEIPDENYDYAPPIKETIQNLVPHMRLQDDTDLTIHLTPGIKKPQHLVYQEAREGYLRDPMGSGHVLVVTEEQYMMFMFDEEEQVWLHKTTLPFVTVQEYEEDPQEYVEEHRMSIDAKISELQDEDEARYYQDNREEFEMDLPPDDPFFQQEVFTRKLEALNTPEEVFLYRWVREEIALQFHEVVATPLRSKTMLCDKPFPTSYFNTENNATVLEDADIYKTHASREVFSRLPEEHYHSSLCYDALDYVDDDDE